MELKEKVLRRLESSRGEYLSGEQLAKDCGVSRNAVWKCVRALKEDGIQIGSVRNRGYVLLAESDALAEEIAEEESAAGRYAPLEGSAADAEK